MSQKTRTSDNGSYHRRPNIKGESYNPEDAEKYEPPVYEKTDKEKQVIRQGLVNHFLFKNLSRDTLDTIIDAMFRVEVMAGEVVIREGEEGDYFYCIQNGVFEVDKIVEGERKLLGYYDGEGCFGELALLHKSEDKWEKMENEKRKRPVIGILAQEASNVMKQKSEVKRLNMESYIAASYVKAAEASGAYVAPIFLNQPEDYYRNILKCVNGVLLPGGNTWFYESDDVTPRNDGYPRAVEIIYKEIKQINKSGRTLPLLGICLGFEILLFVDIGKKEYRSECETIHSPLPINIQENISTSEWTEELLGIFKEPVSYFSHRFYVTEETLKSDKLKGEWKIIGTTREETRNIKFVSIVESIKYPIIGLQYHPEKNAYESSDKFFIPNDEKAIKASRFFFDWLVRMARKNDNSFDNKEQENGSIIHNYKSTYTQNTFDFREMYFFPQKKIINSL